MGGKCIVYLFELTFSSRAMSFLSSSSNSSTSRCSDSADLTVFGGSAAASEEADLLGDDWPPPWLDTDDCEMRRGILEGRFLPGSGIKERGVCTRRSVVRYKRIERRAKFSSSRYGLANYSTPHTVLMRAPALLQASPNSYDIIAHGTFDELDEWLDIF